MANAILDLHSPRSSFVSAATTIIGELPALLPNAEFVVNGVTVTCAEVVAQLKAGVAAVNAVPASRLHTQTLVAAETTAREQLKTLGESLVGYAVAMLGTSSEGVAQLGFGKPKRAEPTVATKLEAQQKAKATRLLRNTMGPKQRQKIHAEPAPSPAPAPAPPAPAAPATPSVTGKGGGDSNK